MVTYEYVIKNKKTGENLANFHTADEAFAFAEDNKQEFPVVERVEICRNDFGECEDAGEPELLQDFEDETPEEVQFVFNDNGRFTKIVSDRLVEISQEEYEELAKTHKVILPVEETQECDGPECMEHGHGHGEHEHGKHEHGDHGHHKELDINSWFIEDLGLEPELPVWILEDSEYGFYKLLSNGDFVRIDEYEFDDLAAAGAEVHKSGRGDALRVGTANEELAELSEDELGEDSPVDESCSGHKCKKITEGLGDTYYCNDCHKYIQADNLDSDSWSEDATPYGGPAEPGFMRDITEYYCPLCGSDDIEERYFDMESYIEDKVIDYFEDNDTVTEANREAARDLITEKFYEDTEDLDIDFDDAAFNKEFDYYLKEMSESLTEDYGWEINPSNAIKAAYDFIDNIGPDQFVNEIAAGLSTDEFNNLMDSLITDYEYDEASGTAMDKLYSLVNYVGETEVADAIIKYLSADKLADLLAFIFRQYDFESEYLEEGCCKGKCKKAKEDLSEGICLKDQAESDEFFRLCQEIGIKTVKDLESFMIETRSIPQNVLQALRDYRADLGDGFKINESNEFDLDFDKLREELEENEDEVECQECGELCNKTDCTFEESVHGYVCPNCKK